MAETIMKSIFFSIIVILGLVTSCSNSTSDRSASKLQTWLNEDHKLKVLSTTAMIDDLVSQIGGEFVQTITLITGELDPHSYQLVKGDDEKLAAADLIFFNGLGLEHGPSLQKYLRTENKAIGLGDKIKEKHPEMIIEVNGQIDPHIWMDITVWWHGIKYIVHALSEKDPSHAEYYQANGQLVKTKLLETNREILEKLQRVPSEKRYLVTSHDAFNYFARAYLAPPDEFASGKWRDRVAAPEGLAPEGQLSAQDIKGIIDYLIIHRITVLFPETNVSKDSIKKIVDAGRKEGLELIISPVPLYADAMGSLGSDGDTYTKMLQHDANVIAEYLSK